MKAARPLHHMTLIPEGVPLGEFLPIYSDVRVDYHVGNPNPECASCRKPFGLVRKRRKAIRVYAVDSVVPFAFSFDICGRCLAAHQHGGADRDAVLASVEAYMHGDQATQ